jgi:hypothetical protein
MQDMHCPLQVLAMAMVMMEQWVEVLVEVWVEVLVEVVQVRLVMAMATLQMQV